MTWALGGHVPELPSTGGDQSWGLKSRMLVVQQKRCLEQGYVVATMLTLSPGNGGWTLGGHRNKMLYCPCPGELGLVTPRP